MSFVSVLVLAAVALCADAGCGPLPAATGSVPAACANRKRSQKDGFWAPLPSVTDDVDCRAPPDGAVFVARGALPDSAPATGRIVIVLSSRYLYVSPVPLSSWLSASTAVRSPFAPSVR